MNCELAHDLLQQSLDGTPIESPEWLTHVRHCTECRALAAAARRLQEGLQQWTAPLPPPGLAERIVERVRLDRHRRRRRVRRRWAVGLALAAGLIVALTLRLDWRGAPSGIQSPPPESVAQNAPDPAPTLRESAAELSEVFTALGNETANETVDQTRLWVAKVPSPALPNVNLTAMEPPTRPLREAGEGVSEGLEPVTTSARRAVDLFLRELPMETN